MGLEKLFGVGSDTSQKVAEALLQAQEWLDDHSRDILDESDEILHARYQLVYTIGQQFPIDGQPYRWTTTQQILRLVQMAAVDMHAKDKSGIELGENNHKYSDLSFTTVRVLHPSAGIELIQYVVQKVMDGHLSNCPFTQFPPVVKNAARQFISERIVESSTVATIASFCDNRSEDSEDPDQKVNTSMLWSILLHLRGLIAFNIIQYSLAERRYRVDFGLDNRRTMLAVPYR